MKPKYFLVKVFPPENGEEPMTEQEIRFQIQYWLEDKDGTVEVKNLKRVFAKPKAIKALQEELAGW